jgi:hypothetical protein
MGVSLCMDNTIIFVMYYGGSNHNSSSNAKMQWQTLNAINIFISHFKCTQHQFGFDEIICINSRIQKAEFWNNSLISVRLFN